VQIIRASTLTLVKQKHPNINKTRLEILSVLFAKIVKLILLYHFLKL